MRGAGARHCNAFGLKEPLDNSNMHDITYQDQCLVLKPRRACGRGAGHERRLPDPSNPHREDRRVHSGAGRRLFRKRSAVYRQWTYAELSGKPNEMVVVSVLDDNLLVQSLVRFT